VVIINTLYFFDNILVRDLMFLTTHLFYNIYSFWIQNYILNETKKRVIIIDNIFESYSEIRFGLDRMCETSRKRVLVRDCIFFDCVAISQLPRFRKTCSNVTKWRSNKTRSCNKWLNRKLSTGIHWIHKYLHTFRTRTILELDEGDEGDWILQWFGWRIVLETVNLYIYLQNRIFCPIS